MEKGLWRPLVDYAFRKNISISTLRRRIKSKDVQYELREGRYFIYDDSGEMPSAGQLIQQDTKNIIAELQEQIADLKTLVKVLESK